MHECPDCGTACCCDQDDLWTDDYPSCNCDCSWARDQGWDDDGDNDWHEQGCCLGARCLHPDPDHLAYECFDEEMAKAYEDETPSTERSR